MKYMFKTCVRMLFCALLNALVRRKAKASCTRSSYYLLYDTHTVKDFHCDILHQIILHYIYMYNIMYTSIPVYMSMDDVMFSYHWTYRWMDGHGFV